MTARDIAPAVEMYRAGGWGERDEFLRWVMSVDTCRSLVGVADGKVVATGLATINGPVGWVGSIFTRTEYRSRGYGRAMTEAACELIEASGCRTAALIASEYGKPLYDSMGFRVDDEYQIYDGPEGSGHGAPAGETSLGVTAGLTCRPLALEDLPAVAALDRRATGEDRSALIASLADRAWIAESGGELRGYLVWARPENGALIADGPDAAMTLLDRLRRTGVRGRRVHAAVPVSHEFGRRLLEAEGWQPIFRTPRMLRGDPVDWRPEMVWSVLGFAFG